MEGLPTRFYRSISSYWRRRKYYKLDGSASAKKKLRVARLGDGRGSQRRFWKLRPVQVRVPSPFRLLARLRDAYMDCMLGLATRGSGLAAPARPEALMTRMNSKSRPAHLKQADFEQRLFLEIYKSVVEPGR